MRLVKVTDLTPPRRGPRLRDCVVFRFVLQYLDHDLGAFFAFTSLVRVFRQKVWIFGNWRCGGTFALPCPLLHVGRWWLVAPPAVTNTLNEKRF